MPRFYVDIREGARFVADEEGLDFKDLAHAEREACVTVAEIGRDKLPKGGLREITAEVRNEHGQRVLTVALSLNVERVDPAPAWPKP
jgi:hypothetical protein